MEILASIVATFFIPCVALGIALGFAWRFVPPGRRRTGLQIAGSILFFVPQPLVLWMGNYSVDLLLAQQVLIALWALGIAALSVAHLRGRCDDVSTRIVRRLSLGATPGEIEDSVQLVRRLQPGRKPRSRLVTVLALVVMVVAFGFSIHHIVGDWLLPRRIVVGRVTGAHVQRHSRSPSWPVVVLAGENHPTTWDLMARLRPGEQIRAQIGAGSGTLLAFVEMPGTH